MSCRSVLAVACLGISQLRVAYAKSPTKACRGLSEFLGEYGYIDLRDTVLGIPGSQNRSQWYCSFVGISTCYVLVFVLVLAPHPPIALAPFPRDGFPGESANLSYRLRSSPTDGWKASPDGQRRRVQRLGLRTVALEHKPDPAGWPGMIADLRRSDVCEVRPWTMEPLCTAT